MAGFDISENRFEKFIDTLESYWKQTNGQLGGSMTLEADADDTSNALFALNSAGRLIDPANCQPILKYFRGNHFATYEYESTVPLTTNFHCLLALKRYKQINEINCIIEKTIEWVRSQARTDDKYMFLDKWHFSPFYPMSRAVLSLEGIDDELGRKCVQQIIDLQHQDGGWGLHHISSIEETAYAVLAVSYWLRKGHKEDYNKALKSLERGKGFLGSKEEKTLWPLWITKSLYCLRDTVEVIIFSAQNSKIV